MINNDNWKKLMQKWHGRIYQNTNKRVKQRLDWFDSVCPKLKGLDVLEIGSNAGLFATEVAKYAKSYLGIDKKDNYYNQAVVTKKQMKLGENIRFKLIKLCDLKEHEKYNAIILSRVLYHLDIDEVKMLKDKILPHCKIAIVICGSKPKAIRKHNNYRFDKPEVVKEFFKEAGMEFCIDMTHERFFAGVAHKHINHVSV